MKVRDESGFVMGLHIGGCSQIKGLSADFVPKVGDIIDW